jgi:hypothetical protein
MAPRPPKPRSIVRRLYFQWRYDLEACISADRLLEGSYAPGFCLFGPARSGSRRAQSHYCAASRCLLNLKVRGAAGPIGAIKRLRPTDAMRQGRPGAAPAVEIPGVVLCLVLVVIHARSRRFLVGFAHGILRACKFYCSLQWAVLILQANFGREGSRAMLVRKRKRTRSGRSAEIDPAPASGGRSQVGQGSWAERMRILERKPRPRMTTADRGGGGVRPHAAFLVSAEGCD